MSPDIDMDRCITEDEWRFFDGKMRITQKTSPEDSARWGVGTMRTHPQSKEDLNAHENWFVIARIDANRLDLLQYALKRGYLFCDTLTYWKGSVNVPTKPLPAGYWMRPIEPRDAKAIESLTRESFTNYQGHYHADPRTRHGAVECYVQWASQFTDGVVIEAETFVPYSREVVAWGGFSAPCELTLGGTHKDHNGKGLYTAFATACAHWGRERGESEIVISTQVTNLAVQKVWARMGLSPYKHVYTLHRWPD